MNLKLLQSKKVIIVGIFCLIFVTALYLNNSQLLLEIKDTVINSLEKELGSEISVTDIKIGGLNKVILTKASIMGDQKEKLLETKKIVVNYNLSDFFLKSLNPLESISSIQVIEPQILLSKEKEWNYTSILDNFNTEHKSKPASKGNLFFPIYIEGGKVNYLTPEIKDKLEQISGKIILGNKIRINLKAKLASISQEEFSVRGIIKDNKYQGDLKFSQLSLLKLKEKFKSTSLEGVNLEGSLEGKLKIKGSLGETPSYFGDLELKDGILAKDEVNLRAINGQFGINKYGIKIKELSAFYREFPIQLAGEIFSWNNPQLNLEYNLNEIALEEVMELLPNDLNIKGDAKIEGKVKGKLQNPSVIGQVKMSSGQIAEFDLEEFSSRIYYKDRMLNLEELKFNYGQGQVQGGGTIAFDKEVNYIFTTSFKDINLAHLDSAIDYNLKGKGLFQGDIMISGVGLAKDKLNVLGSISANHGSIREYNFDSLQTNLWLNNSKLFLNHTELKTPQSNYNLEGLITLDGNLNLSFQANQVRLDQLKDIHRLDNLKGVIDLSGELKGSFASPEVKGQFNINSLKYNDFRLENTFGKLNLVGKELELKDVELPQLASKLSGGINLLTKESNLTLDTVGVKTKKLLTALGIDLPISGVTSGQVVVGAIDPLQVTGNLFIQEGKAFKQKFDQADLNFKYQDQKFIIDTSQAIYNKSTLIAKGSYVNDRLKLDFSSNNLKLKDINYIPSEVDLVGQTKVDGRVYGPTSNLKVKGQIDANQIKVNDNYLGQVVAKLSYEKTKLNVIDGLIKGMGNQYLFDGSLDLYHNQIDSFVADIQQGSFDYVAQFLPFELDLPYQFMGQLKAIGPLSEPKLELDFRIPDAKKGGYLDLQGSYWINKDLNLNLSTKEFNISPINNLGLIPYDLSGSLNMVGSLTGTVDKLNFDSNIRVTDGKLAGLSYQELGGRVRLIDSQKIILNQKLRVKGANVLQAKGHIPLLPTEEFDLNLNLKEGNLSLLPLWITDIKSAKGRGRADIRLLGTWEDPKLTGKAEVISGTLSYPVLDRRISNLNGTVNFVGEEIIFSGVEGDYGDGDFELKGAIGLDGFKPKDFDLEFIGDDIAFEHGSWQGINDLKIEIKDAITTPLITGEIIAHDTEFSLPFNWPVKEDGKESKIKPQFDLEIKPGKNVKVGNDNIDIMIQAGELNLATDNQRLELTGKLESSYGQFNYYNTEFELEKGSAIFRKYSYIPNLQIKASTHVKDTEIYLNLNGLANHLDFELSSKPPLTRKEIIGLLTNQGGIGNLLEKNYEEAVKNEMWRMIGEGIQNELISKVEESFERSLDLDQVRIKSVLDNEIKIELGKFITDDFMLKYDHTFGIEEEQSFGFEYHLNQGLDNLQIDGHYNNHGEYQLGLEATMPF